MSLNSSPTPSIPSAFPEKWKHSAKRFSPAFPNHKTELQKRVQSNDKQISGENAHDVFEYTVFLFIPVCRKITHGVPRGYTNITEKPKSMEIQFVTLIDDGKFTLQRIKHWLRRVRRPFQSGFHQLKFNVEGSGDGLKYDYLDDPEDRSPLHLSRLSLYLDAIHDKGELIAQMEWRKYTLILQNGLKFTRVNFPDGTFYMHFSSEGEFAEMGEILPSTTAFALARRIGTDDDKTRQSILESVQKDSPANPKNIDPKRQSILKALHAQRVHEMFDEGRLPDDFSFIGYNFDTDVSICELEEILKMHKDLAEKTPQKGERIEIGSVYNSPNWTNVEHKHYSRDDRT
uniref:Uncharacterized protein n=1 Tax=Percolomonas cosmopolitus TaxID=63605 RepID=A0A7S1KS70_9EUKA